MQYSDLSAQYVEFCKKEDAYWDFMRLEAVQLVTEYIESLSLDRKEFKNIDGSTDEYVVFGVKENGMFKKCNPIEIPHLSDLSFRFCITTYLEKNHADCRKCPVVTEIVIRRSIEFLSLTVNGSIEPLHVPVYKEPGKYAKLLDVIKENISRQLDPLPYL